ncbi:MAG: SocA family protein [Syntrophales bacterium LBB04]|nr:SocA family protein [Syntrophales bacterium LBB04]
MPSTIPYREEKIKNAICFFASEHEKRTRKPLSQTFLYKYLAFLDFKSIELIGRPALGLVYSAMDKGPVPIDIYAKRDNLKNECFVFVPLEEEKYIVKANGKPDLDYFSRFEITEMSRLVEIYADYFVKASDISEASHETIDAWKKTWARKRNAIINYDDVFVEDLLTKPEADLSFAEESYLLYKALEKACR